MASVSGTSSLGNTSLRGYGGFASGIDRDAVIEQMTMGTTTKINNHKSAMETLKWKQEVYQGITEKIVGLTDDYFSYTSSFNLKEPSLFARSIITSLGDDKVTKFVQATGSSALIDQLSILKVSQLATASVQKSARRQNGSIETSLSSLDDTVTSSKLRGSQLWFGTYNSSEQILENRVKFELPDSYTDDSGVTHKIDYTTTNYSDLARQLNEGLKDSGVKLGDKKISEVIQFNYNGSKMEITSLDPSNNFVMDSSSTALEGLGYIKNAGRDKDGVSITEYNDNLDLFENSYIDKTKFADYLKGKKLTFDYNGSKKEIELMTAEEATAFAASTESGGVKLARMAANIQKRLDRAFGDGNVKVSPIMDSNGNVVGTGPLSFKTNESSSTVAITSSDNVLLKNLGIAYGASNKINSSGTLEQNSDILGIDPTDSSEMGNYFDTDGNMKLKINGVDIKGLNKNSTINDIIKRINSTADAGVKASYVESTGQFVLISSETGANRSINLDSPLAKKLFEDTSDPSDPKKGFIDGTNAKVTVRYGNGMDVDIERSSNTFDLEGMKVTVSGTFDGVTDPSLAVSFSAKADADGVTEKMTKFFEAYNELVTEINTQLTTKKDSSYGPLTEEQKAEMSETSIENWEKKAKQGLLFGDSILRDLGMDVQNVLLNVISNGGKFDDLEEIGITISEDAYSGGTITFDANTFKDAMTNNPDKVANLIAGGGDVKKGIAQIMEETFTPYATRYAYKNGGSYGRLVEEAGSEKMPLSVSDNYIYKQLKDMEETLAKLKTQLSTQQDRYIRQFTTMETLISQMNSQAGWLSQLQS